MTAKHVRRSARAAVVGVVSFTAVCVGGAAFAFWTTSGTGTGTGQSAAFQPVTVTAGAAPAGQLYPGLVADGTTKGGDLVVVAANPNPFPVVVALTAGTATGCTTPAVSLLAGTTLALAANASSATYALPKVLSMGDSSSNCQGATITVALTTTSTSS
jgi:hypothetical protein